MSRFGPDPRAFFDTIYEGEAPWDIGAPQPGLARLLEELPPEGRVLDLGCGTGDLAIWLAQRGHPVLGVDFAEAAVVEARARAARAGSLRAPLEFEVGDATRPAQLGRGFGAVVDSGFYHLFDEAGREALAAELALALAPGGRYYLQAFALEFEMENTPMQVSEAELRTRFGPGRGWQVLAVREAEFLSRVAPPVPAIAACLGRVTPDRPAPRPA